MRFEELKKKSYFRDRTEEFRMEDSIAYFEEIKIKDIKEDEMFFDRIHTHFKEDGTISKSTDTLTQGKDNWDNGGWAKIKLISKEEMYRRVIKYIWE